MAGHWRGRCLPGVRRLPGASPDAAAVQPVPGDRAQPTAQGVAFTGAEAGILMRSVVAGAGPTGLYTAVALARRGHQVTVIDRDPGPAGGQWWDRKGVMQFHHPHFSVSRSPVRCWLRCPRSGAAAGGRGCADSAARPARRAGRAALPARHLRAGPAGRRPGRAPGCGCAQAMSIRCAARGDASPGSWRAAVRSTPTWSSTRAAGLGG